MDAQELKFRLKLGRKETDLYNLSDALNLYTIMEIVNEQVPSDSREIHVKRSDSDVEFVFLVDSSCKMSLNAARNGVTLSQYGIDIYEILAVSEAAADNLYYIIYSKQMNESSKQARHLVTPLISSIRHLYLKFGSAPATARLPDPEGILFSAPVRLSPADMKSFLKFENMYYREYQGCPWKKVKFLHLHDAEPLEIFDEANNPIELATYMEFISIASVAPRK